MFIERISVFFRKEKEDKKSFGLREKRTFDNKYLYEYYYNWHYFIFMNNHQEKNTGAKTEQRAQVKNKLSPQIGNTKGEIRKSIQTLLQELPPDIQSLIKKITERCIDGEAINFENNEYDKHLALSLILAGKSDLVIERIKTLQNLDDDVALALIDAGKSESVIVHFFCFQIRDHKKLIMSLSSQSICLLSEKKIRACTNLDEEVALRLMQNKKGERVATCHDVFQNFDEQQLLQAFIDTDQSDVVCNHLGTNEGDPFQKTSHNYIVQQLLNAQAYKQVAIACSENKFKKLSLFTVKRIIENTPIDIKSIHYFFMFFNKQQLSQILINCGKKKLVDEYYSQG